jgi:DNA polymerase-3 subunit delta
MGVKPSDLDALLNKTGPAPLYLIVGEEDCLRDQALVSIKRAVLGAPPADPDADTGTGTFNSELLYGDEDGAAEILMRVQEAPIFAERRLVLVKNADKLSARDGEELTPYLKAPNPTTTLVFSAVKLDGRLKFGQALNKAATVIDCAPLPEAALAAWITEEAARCGLRLNDDALALLKELAGTSLTLVQRELEKLAAYVPAGREAGGADVAALRGIEPGASVFDLAAAIGERDRPKMLLILARNLEAGEAPLRILGSLAWQYRRIWKAKDGIDRGGTDGEAARLLRLPPFKVRAFLSKFTDSHLRGAFHLFLETDAKLKGGSGSAGGPVLERMLLALCPPVASVASAGRPAAQPAPGAGPGKRTISNVRTIRTRRPSAH